MCLLSFISFQIHFCIFRLFDAINCVGRLNNKLMKIFKWKMSVQIEGEKSRRKDWNVVNDFERTKQKEQLIYGHDYNSHISFNTLHSLSLQFLCVVHRWKYEKCFGPILSLTTLTVKELKKKKRQREAFMSGQISGSTSENNPQIWRKLNHKFLIFIFVMIITSLWPFASLFVSIFMDCFFSFSLAESILHF